MNQFPVKMGEVDVCSPGAVLKTAGVGSCVVIVFYDATTKYAGMAHAMLPCSKGSDVQIRQHPERYVEIAIETLLHKLEIKGVSKHKLKAWLVGGAQMFARYESSKMSIGQQNIAAAKQKLSELGIDIQEEDTGGHKGRNVQFNSSNGSCTVECKM